MDNVDSLYEELQKLLLEADNLFKKGQFKKAIEKFKCVEEKLHPEINEIETLRFECFHGMGDAEFKSGNFQKALVLSKKAEESLGENGLEKYPCHYAKCMTLQGEIHKDSGNQALALECFQKAFKIYTFAGKEVETLKAYNMLGEVAFYNHDIIKAYEIFTKVFIGLTKALGTEEDEFVARLYNNVGACLSEINPFNRAAPIESYSKSLAIKARVLGEDHPDYALGCYNMGFSYMESLQFESALEYFNKTIEIHVRCNRQNHPAISTCYVNIASIYDQKGKKYEAMKFSRLAIKNAKGDIQFIGKRLQNIFNKLVIFCWELQPHLSIYYAEKTRLITKARKSPPSMGFTNSYATILKNYDERNPCLDLDNV